MSIVSSYTVSHGDSIEAILLEEGDYPTGLVDNCSLAVSSSTSKENSSSIPIKAIRGPRRSVSKLMDVSNQSNSPFMPSKMGGPKDARSKYEQLRSAQQFASKKEQEKQKVVTLATREVALAWMEMGETYSKPKKLHCFSQFQAPRSLSVCSSSQLQQQQQQLQLQRPQKNIVKKVSSWRPSAASNQRGGERTQDRHDTRTVPESRDASHMKNVGGSDPFFQCDPTSLRSIDNAPDDATITRTAYTGCSSSKNDRSSKTHFGTNGSIDQEQSVSLDRRNTKRQEAREQPQPQQGSRRQKEKQQSSISKMSASTSDASHWKSAVDPRSGRTYFYHDLTRETQWRKPTELASVSERRTMEEKERKQKDFFAAMEANILNSMSNGVVPGTPKDPQEGLLRKKSTKQLAPSRPELVRTISAMDETVLRDLIRRQPSYRNMSLQKAPSLTTGDLVRPEGPEEGEEFESIRSNTHFLDPLHESMREFMESAVDFDSGSVFDNFPNEDPDTPANMSVKSSKSHASQGGKLNESISGFGLTREEAQALKKLADITKEMIDVEKEEDMSSPNGFPVGGEIRLGGGGGGTPGWKPSKDTKAARELPRELDFSDDDSEPDLIANKANNNNTTPHIESASKLSGGARMLPRDLEFSDDSDSETSDLGETPKPVKQKSVRIMEQEREKPKKEALIERPKVTRRNTCGTLYVGTTMSAPDKDATIKVRSGNVYCAKARSLGFSTHPRLSALLFFLEQCVCGVLRAHILASAQPQNADESDDFLVFNDLESQQDYFGNGVTISRPKYHSPSLEEVTSFYRDVFFKAQMETDCIIMSLIYVERLIKRTNGDLRPRARNWRSLLFSCMILSSKVWDDLSMWVSYFP
jgi:hypothetical protein